MKILSQKICKPCEGGVLPLTKKESEKFLKMTRGWKLETKHLTRKFKFKDFKEALKFVNDIGKIAEKEGHHPDIALGWGYVSIKLTTHSINGLSENDFILAAKINKIK